MLTGTKLNRYEIIEKIGVGGMGEVYLARDTQLDRNIALKVLLPEIAKDEDRLRRFKLEAKAASALNHPNIITIYEIGEAEDRLFIAYEYIEGKTLREKIKRNQLTVSDSIKITDQIANALAVAHRAGIVHRDIKPENTMIRDDGYVKILDFGLAKQRIFTSGSKNEALEQVKTQKGLILGSAQYMSPEQARGKEIDERTDIWSLGVVLYEMLSGKNPFEGETISDSIAAILYAEIEPINNFVPDIPLKLQQIIEKSIKKDLFERYQSISDFIKDLRNLRETLKDDVSTAKLERSALNVKTIELKNQTTDEKKKTKKRKWLLIPAIGLAGLIVFALYDFFHPTFFPNYYNRFTNKEVTALTNDGKSHSAAILPDGKFIAFVKESEGKQSLILKEIETGNEKEIVPPAKVEFLQPTFSYDGGKIYYVTKENGVGTLYNIDLERLKRSPERNDSDRKLIVDIDSKITFSPDGGEVYYVTKENEVGTLYNIDIVDIDSKITYLPDGRSFAFIRHNTSDKTDTIFVTDTYSMIETSLTKRLTTGETQFKKFNEVSWLPAKDQFAVVGILKGSGLTQNLSFRSIAAKTYGEASFWERNMSFYSLGFYDLKNYIWLKDTTYYYLQRRQINDASQIEYEVPSPYKGRKNITNDLNDYSSFDVTADGNTIVATKTDRLSSIWSYIPQTKELKQLTADSKTLWAENGISQMTDGRILYSKKTDKEVYSTTSHNGKEEKILTSNEIQIFVADEDGSNEKQLTSESEYNFNPTATPDGKYILFISGRNGAYNIWRMDTDGNNPIQLTANLDKESGIQITPDSKTVIFTQYRNKGSLMKIPIDGGEAAALIPDSQSSYFYPRISPNGKYLAYLSVQYDKAASNFKELVNVVELTKGKAGNLILEEEFDFPSTLQWSPDSKSLCFIEKQKTDFLWSFSINDKKETSLTEFDSGNITNFTWSQNGKKLLIVRSAFKNDLVLIKDSDKIPR